LAKSFEHAEISPSIALTTRPIQAGSTAKSARVISPGSTLRRWLAMIGAVTHADNPDRRAGPVLDFRNGFVLRRATEADHAAMCRVCVRTGRAGEDATSREDDPQLMGMIYAVPYQVLEPELAFIVDGPDGVCGYLLGTADTHRFNNGLAKTWYPKLQATIRDPGDDRSSWRGSDWARHAIHHPKFGVFTSLGRYPAHGHIDLLPEARGRGVGTGCMMFLEQALAQTGASGMHLDVHPDNGNAQAFYRKLGFKAVSGADLPDSSLFMAKRFGA
jgi:ribosomal protein S18 acetylase RimI-like enzyme